MAKKWSEVASNPEFVAMPYEQKLDVRKEYFDNVVAPHVPENLRQVERMKFEDYAVIEAPTTGVGGAFGSSVDRIQAGVQTLMGDHEGAAANIQEARKYQPTIGSYKDVTDVPTAFEYASELVAGAAPYLAAPVAGAGMVAVGAPAATVATGAALLMGAIEGGTTYAEQEKKNAPAAVVTGLGAALFERLPGLQGKTAPLFKMLENSPLIKNVVVKSVEGSVEELATTTGQTVLSGTVGHGQSFADTIQNLDEQLIAGLTTRGSLAAPRVATQTVTPVSSNLFERDSAEKKSNRNTDNSELNQALTDPTLSIKELSKEVEKLWTGRDMENTAEAAQKLQDRGAELSPVALNIPTTRKIRDPNTGEHKIVEINLGKEMGIGTLADKTARKMAANFKVPFFGSFVDPKQGYETTNAAYKGWKSEFDAYISNTLSGLEMTNTARKDISRDIQNYVLGRKPKLEESTKITLANINDMNIFDSISQTKRMRQMADNMKPEGTGGTLGGALGLGTEAVVTGGIPVFSATIGTVGSAMAAGLNKVQKDKMKSIIDGEGTPESKLEKLFKALDDVDFYKAGFAEGIEEDIKPDMGMMEVVK